MPEAKKLTPGRLELPHTSWRHPAASTSAGNTPDGVYRARWVVSILRRSLVWPSWMSDDDDLCTPWIPQQNPAHLGFGTSGKRVVERCGWNPVRLSYFQLRHFVFRTSFCCAADCILPAVKANSRRSERTVPQSVGRTMRRKLGMLQSNSSPRRTKLRWACSTSSKGVLASTNKVISCNSGQIWISEFEDTWKLRCWAAWGALILHTRAQPRMNYILGQCVPRWGMSLRAVPAVQNDQNVPRKIQRQLSSFLSLQSAAALELSLAPPLQMPAAPSSTIPRALGWVSLEWFSRCRIPKCT